MLTFFPGVFQDYDRLTSVTVEAVGPPVTKR